MIQVLDATLREGEQAPGVYFDGHIKLAIAELLEDIGVDIIEAGHPVVSREIHDAVKRIAACNSRALVGAHARSLEADVDLALESGADFLGIFYCVSAERLTHVFKNDLNVAIDRITKTIAYAKSIKPELLIRYTPEDTVRSPFQNVLDAAAAAVAAGADIISIADTTGFMVPGTERSMYDYVARLKGELAKRNAHPKIAVHCHNDRGLALANALDGLRGGAEIIDVSVLGLGERAGIVDLAQLLVTLTVDFDTGREWDLKKLQQLYALVSEHAQVPIPAHFPIMGAHAFTHCAGVHTHAATINPAHYQSLSPEIVGREMDICLDHMSGLSSVQWALERIGVESDSVLTQQVLQMVKSVGQKGRAVGLHELPHIVKWCKTHQVETN